MKLLDKMKNILKIHDRKYDYYVHCPCCHRIESSKSIMIKNVARCSNCGAFFDIHFAKRFIKDDYGDMTDARKRVLERKRNLKKNWGHGHNVRK
ncbi:hypothetical protein PBI_SCTP2_347 [Salicola phage SCTP-2]|nr:hypothetical protein PBI_SCTP2_347 [Salicola phage SCTP-2]